MEQHLYDIIIQQGNTFDLYVEWLDSNSQPIDLTGYTAKLQARTAAGAVAVIDLADGTGLTNNGVLGSYSIHMTALQTAALTVGAYVYDMQLTAPDTVTKTRLIEGTVTVTVEIVQ